ncbi:hypothetical protein KR009_001535 [Drosophila setifemur]|nr:hypothetical protein KR009_001535 [Drosophila setifemur]
MDSLKNLGYIVLLMTLISGGTEAANPYRTSPYYNTFCMDTQTGRQLYVGEVFTRQGQCVRVQCLGTLQLWEDSCLVPELTKGDCNPVHPTEENLPYPRCCPLYECRSYESNAGGTVELSNTYDHYGTLRQSHLTEVIRLNRRRPPVGTQVEEQMPVRKYQVSGVAS